MSDAASGGGNGAGLGTSPAAAALFAQLMGADGKPGAEAVRTFVEGLGIDPEVVVGALGGSMPRAAAPAEEPPLGAVMDGGAPSSPPRRGNVPRRQKAPAGPGQPARAPKAPTPGAEQAQRASGVKVNDYLNRSGGAIQQLLEGNFGDLPVELRVLFSSHNPPEQTVLAAIFLPEDEEVEEEQLSEGVAPASRFGDLLLHVIGEAGANLDRAAEADPGDGGDQDGQG